MCVQTLCTLHVHMLTAQSFARCNVCKFDHVSSQSIVPLDTWGCCSGKTNKGGPKIAYHHEQIIVPT